MATLFIPLHLPTGAIHSMLNRELKYRDVLSVKVDKTIMTVEHEAMSHESAAELLSCIEAPIIVT
jgi:hypothetical protein